MRYLDVVRRRPFGRTQPIAGLALVAVIVVPGGARVAAQGERSRPTTAHAIPRTPDGHPDMQGVWTHGTLTPFERPEALGTKTTYTPTELREAERQLRERRASAAANARPGDVGGDNEAFVDSDYTMLSSGQTSLVVDPPDGRVPFRKEALTRAAFNTDSRDDYETMSPWDRCVTRGPTVMLPAGYNNGTQIVQTPGLVMIEAEMVHEVRVIPTDGRSHRATQLRTWLGDPVGHWEGDTLVVDSTNYRDDGWLSTHAGSGRLRGIPISKALHIVERFTLKDADTILFEMVVDDPAMFTRPWTVSLPLHRDVAYQMYESACHEGNQDIELVLRGARSEERDAASPGR
jgi:hypothetical protein